MTFDIEPHRRALKDAFRDRFREVEKASLASVVHALEEASRSGAPFDYLHLVAHGSRHEEFGAVVLESSDGGMDAVPAQRLAQRLRGHGLRFGFLCSCQSSVADSRAFGGVAQMLLAREGAGLECVVATQANLPVAGSADLAEHFYRLLAEGSDPSAALGRARVVAYDRHSAWSAPVLWTLPPPRTSPTTALAVPRTLPELRSTYLARPVLDGEIDSAVRNARLVSIVGLPGIGKTEIGKAAGKRWLEQGWLVLFRDVTSGMSTDRLRALLSADLGRPGAAQEDRHLGALFHAREKETLLILDNAEDMMRSEGEQRHFAEQLDTWLAFAPALRVLLTTRWPVEATNETERIVDIPPMGKDETERLLTSELGTAGRFRADWRGSRTWNDLLAMIDGHPRTLYLVSKHFDGASIEDVVDRLRQKKQDAVLLPGLFGRPQEYDAVLKDRGKKARMESLVASMDLSFEVVETRHPDAIELMLGLSLFPGGVPDSVATSMAGGPGSSALSHLYRYRLIEWRDHRAYFPIPLHWYCEHKRKARRVDPGPWMSRAAVAFADFVQACDLRFTSGSIAGAINSLLPEETSLIEIARDPSCAPVILERQSALAWIAAAASNLFLYTAKYETLQILLDRGLDAARSVGDRLGEAHCLKGLGSLRARTAGSVGSLEAYRQALTLYRGIHTRHGRQGLAGCLQSVGDLKERLDDLDGARADLLEALRIHRDIHDRSGEATSLRGLGDLHIRLIEPDQALVVYQEALLIYREIRNRLGEATCLHCLGTARLHRGGPGDLEEARKAFEEALPISRESRNRLDEANCLQSLGDVKMRVSDLDGARASFEAALVIYTEHGDQQGAANCLHGLARIVLESGNPAGAFRELLTCLNAFRALPDSLGEQASLNDLARAARNAGAPQQALLLAEEALVIGRTSKNVTGQIHSLKLQARIWVALQNLTAAAATVLVYPRTIRGIGKEGTSQELGLLQSLLSMATPAERARIEGEPETARLLELARIREELRRSGRGAFDAP